MSVIDIQGLFRQLFRDYGMRIYQTCIVEIFDEKFYSKFYK